MPTYPRRKILMRKVWMVKLSSSFFCVDIRTGHPATTLNPRKAMRWFDWAPAEQMARRCGQGWAAVAVEIPRTFLN